MHNRATEEIAVFDPSNPLPFHVQCLRMAAQAAERALNDQRPQNPDFLPAMLEEVILQAAQALAVLRGNRMRQQSTAMPAGGC